MTTEALREAAPPPPPATTRSTAVVVLGAGRSGTSVLTRGLQAIGVDLGDRLRRAGGKNPAGFFEDRDLLALNRKLKRALGIRGRSVRLIDEAEWQAPSLQALQGQAVETVRRRFGASPLWGYKYGRTLRLLPFWQAVYGQLDLDVRYVVAVRNPLSVAHSRSLLEPERGRRTWSDLEWLVNVVPYFDRLRGRPLVVVDYDALMDAPAEQLRRVAGRLDLPLERGARTALDDYAATFVRTGMRHSRFRPQDLREADGVHPLVRDAYGWLFRLATDEVRGDDRRLWEEWGRLERSLAALGPVLGEMEWLRERLERARWNPLTPLPALGRAWRALRSR